MTYGEDEARNILKNKINWPIAVNVRGTDDNATLDYDQVAVKGGLRTEIHVQSRRKELLAAFKTELEQALAEATDDDTVAELTRISGKPNQFLLTALPADTDSSLPHQY